MSGFGGFEGRPTQDRTRPFSTTVHNIFRDPEKQNWEIAVELDTLLLEQNYTERQQQKLKQARDALLDPDAELAGRLSPEVQTYFLDALLSGTEVHPPTREDLSGRNGIRMSPPPEFYQNPGRYF